MMRRYRLTVKGRELLNDEGVHLFLPNHPAQVDAPLLGAYLQKKMKVVPIISERFVSMPVVGYFMKKMDPISVADLSAGRRDPDVLKKILSQSAEKVKKGKNLILYPAGQIKTAAAEEIGNKQSAYLLSSSLPEEVKIVGVRIKGLWGSMWSRSERDDKPNFGLTLLKGMLLTFANLIFFQPKRKVEIEFVDISKEARQAAKGSRRDFNRYLEEFYNSPKVEEIVKVRYFYYLPI